MGGSAPLADREILAKLCAEAKDIRPTLVFIDEADDVLRNRQFSNTPDLINRMLAMMDGVEEKINDVAFLAATINPDQVEPAAVRGLIHGKGRIDVALVLVRIIFPGR